MGGLADDGHDPWSPCPEGFAAHVTGMPSFKAVTAGMASLTLTMAGAPPLVGTVQEPASPGIFRPLITPTKAGKCELSKPPQSGAAPAGKAECAAASECEVWCCQEDLQAAVKGKKPRNGCKRCPKPQPAAECLEGKCAVAPHALEK